MNPTIDVSVILVGLNAHDYIKQCIESICRADWDRYSYEVIYIDNGSSDNTLQMIEQKFPAVRSIANPHNRGYCPAANQGAEIAGGRHFLFLNDDTIVLDDAIPMLVSFLDDHGDTGIIGSRLLYPDMTEQWSGRMFPTFLNAFLGRRSWLTRFFPNSSVVKDYLCKEELARGKPFEVDWVSAAAMLVRRETFFAINGLAEDYYYWHEAVFCDRARGLGQKTCLHPQSKIIHYEGKGSGDRPYNVQKFHIKDFHQGAYRCYCEHYGLGACHPRALLVGGMLTVRAYMLLYMAWLRAKTSRGTFRHE